MSESKNEKKEQREGQIWWNGMCLEGAAIKIDRMRGSEGARAIGSEEGSRGGERGVIKRLGLFI